MSTEHTNGTTATASAGGGGASAADIYDRQIRLWGADSQAKLANAKVLYIHVTGVTSEVLKNLVLAGISATICDTRPFILQPKEDETILPCFFQSLARAADDNADNNNTNNDGEQQHKDKKQKTNDDDDTTTKQTTTTIAERIKPIVEELNPLLGTCPIITKSVSELTKEDLNGYTVVIASRISIEEAIRIDNLLFSNNNNNDTTSQQQQPKFYMADCFGMNGCCLLDLGEKYMYRPEQGKNKLLDPTMIKTTTYTKNNKNNITIKDGERISFQHIFNNIILSNNINRFHKIPPPVWVQYRCILQYISTKCTSSSSTWPTLTEDNDDDTTIKDFVSTIQKWIPTQENKDNNNDDNDNKSLSNHPSLSEESLKELATVMTAEIAPVCSVLGGMIGNEVIKVISGKGEPANNTILLDGTTCKAWTFIVQ